MPDIAAHTLGCKVNQYDTQAMLELFLREGYRIVPVDQPADVYLINTCTVTGTGDKKSLQLIRKIRREYPSIKNDHSTKVHLGMALKELGFEGKPHGGQTYYRVVPVKVA